MGFHYCFIYHRVLLITFSRLFCSSSFFFFLEGGVVGVEVLRFYTHNGKNVFLPKDIWQDVYFDDESAEVVISSLRLGDDQDRYMTLHFGTLLLVGSL